MARYSALDGVAQFDVQTLLSDLLDEAAAAACLDRSAWQKQPQGDGELALVPPDQPEPRIVDDFIRELDAVLRLRNHGRVPAARLRLRAAIDFGVAYKAAFGFAGDAVVTTARLLASDSLHHALADTKDADLAVALSVEVYQTVLNRHTSLSPEEFVRAEVSEKEYSADAWIRVLPRSAAAIGSAGERSQPTPAPATPSTPTTADSRQSARPASVSGNSVKNHFHGPVDAGVIGINIAAAPGEQP